MIVSTNDIRLIIEINKAIHINGDGTMEKGETRELAYKVKTLRENIPTVKFATLIGLEKKKPLSKKEIIEQLAGGKKCQASS